MNPSLPDVRGEYRYNSPLAKTTWFGVGGNADIIFKPADTDDLANFIKNKSGDLQCMTLGVCSNVIIRDGGFRGCVIKLGRSFTDMKLDGDKIIIGATALDTNVAKFAAENNIGGLEFLIGVPGTIGGAIAMNAGAYGTEIKDVLISAKAIDDKGNIINISNKEFGFTYRKNSLSPSLIFIEATLHGTKANREDILEKMKNITDSREATQPIRTKTGGSTFKNPPGDKKAWQLIDEAGFRGYRHGGAMVSDKHCNFLINTGNATAKDIEELGEEVRAKVKEKFGIELEWEIKRIGER
jgi:UDP-N-acetylmuramate dehydrogenase